MIHRIILTLLGAAIFALPSAQAAVRVCSELVVSISGKGRTGQIARKAALQDWYAKVKEAGYPNAHWRLAADKSLSCSRPAPGTFVCVAIGRPCTIKNVPPEGLPLLRDENKKNAI